MREHVLMLAFIAAMAAVVALAAVNVLRYQQEQTQIVERQVERAKVGCETSIQGRALQLLNGEVLIAATTDGEELDAETQRTIERYRSFQELVFISELPPVCAGQMTLSRWQREVRAEVDRGKLRLEREDAHQPV
jgi:hypothetical protein